MHYCLDIQLLPLNGQFAGVSIGEHLHIRRMHPGLIPARGLPLSDDIESAETRGRLAFRASMDIAFVFVVGIHSNLFE